MVSDSFHIFCMQVLDLNISRLYSIQINKTYYLRFQTAGKAKPLIQFL